MPKTQIIEQTTSTVPKYVEPYLVGPSGLLPRAEAVSNTPYQAYGGQRLEGFNPQQIQVQNEVAGMQTPGQFGTGTALASAAGLGALNAANYDPSQFSYQNIGQPNLQQYQMDAAQTFGNDQAQQYMSPYVQNVLDIQKREALRDAQKAQLAGNLGAARQGTYGGARQLLATTERERNLGTQMGDIQAKGLQAAYENAQTQFNADRSAQFGVGKENLAAQLGVQELGTNKGLEALLANQKADQEAQRQAEQSRQFGATQSLNGYEAAGNMAQTLANLGSGQQQADLARLQAQNAAGSQVQAYGQQAKDLAYQDLQNQRDYPQHQLDYLSNIIRGLPNYGSNSTTTGPAPSAAAQIGGAGLGIASMYNLLK